MPKKDAKVLHLKIHEKTWWVVLIMLLNLLRSITVLFYLTGFKPMGKLPWRLLPLIETAKPSLLRNSMALTWVLSRRVSSDLRAIICVVLDGLVGLKKIYMVKNKVNRLK